MKRDLDGSAKRSADASRPPERPILFSAPMVRAILEGRKTVTRRIVKPQPPADCRVWAGWILDSTTGDDVGKASWHDQAGPLAFKTHRVRCPYGMPGDRLWVRETHAFRDWDSWIAKDPKAVIYAADYNGTAWARKMKPSIHMPRWASRLTLEITDVRVERLQDITEAEAIAEGVGPLRADGRMQNGLPATDGYADLWEAINGPKSWDLNPWVWAVSFSALEAAGLGGGEAVAVPSSQSNSKPQEGL